MDNAIKHSYYMTITLLKPTNMPLEKPRNIGLRMVDKPRTYIELMPPKTEIEVVFRKRIIDENCDTAAR